ncbi:general transcription factor IIE subunit 2 [Hydra vulgaris]|uniref:Transcription initiation factor IIE subunit beta n=1 Tax=Hydra vulgaris TaxID=6087 RepID=T2MGC7_HYDVU|nr:general transcription factor IIE subunit 2 [Hydra vulgaris]
MDPSLMKDLNAFKKRSLNQPAVESKKQVLNTAIIESVRKPKKRRRPELPPQLLQQSKKQAANQAFNYKTHTQIRTKSRFSILSSIVDLVKNRYQNKEFEPLTLDELLDLTKNTDIKSYDKEWLADESLKNNPKILFKDDKYSFKPKYALRDKKSLIRLLEKHDQSGLGGVLLDDVREGLPNADEIVKSISDKIMFVTRSNDKKAILFYYDSSYAVHVDEENQKHWRSVAVEGLAEPDIEKYLSNCGISTMTGVSSALQKRPEKRKGGKRKKNMRLLNSHLVGDVLKDYSEPSK